MTLRGQNGRAQGRSARLSIYLLLVLALGVVTIVCVFPYLAAPVSTGAAVLATAISLVKTRQGARPAQPRETLGTSAREVSGGSDSSCSTSSEAGEH